MRKQIILGITTLAVLISVFAAEIGSIDAQNTTGGGGNMTVGGNITNATTGGGGNMTVGGNITNAPPGSGD
jgi:hypothetical protein